MIRSFWKIHCEGWFGSSELAADGSAEAERARRTRELTRCQAKGRHAARQAGTTPPASPRSTSHKAHRSSSH